MGKKRGSLVWLWVLLVIGVLAAVGYGWYKYPQPETGEELVAVEVLTPEESRRLDAGEKGPGKDSFGKQSDAAGSSGKTLKAGDVPADQAPTRGIIEKGAFLKPQATGELVEYQFESDKKKPLFENEPGQKDLEKIANAKETRYCSLLKEHVADFFQYLDTKKYIQQMNLGETAYARFVRIIERLAAQPPIPAGEGVDPTIMVKNIYFFCRALDKKDLRLIQQAVADDQDTLEDNMGMFYQWAMLGKRCSNLENVRPSFEALYRYAGFFLNTTGGRAYMFRRGLKLRLLITYYSVQIIYQADKAGKNSYGINGLPYIKPLMEEMSNYPGLLYKESYLETLTKIQNFYSGRR